MKPFIAALSLAMIVGAAAPASALSFSIDMPHLTFPPTDTTVTQGCADMSVLTPNACGTTGS